MYKSYIDCMDEITKEEIYEGLLGYGMFGEKLPPVFSSLKFYEYCKTNNPKFDKKSENKYICFESMRNTNVPRVFSIPTPMKYEVLCREIEVDWDKIRDVYRQNTKDGMHKVSRLHIRKKSTDASLLEMTYEVEPKDDYEILPTVPEVENDIHALFSMNYKNWKVDGDPLMDTVIGKRYVVHADISQCFPSIYTHSLCWALVGKDIAKHQRNGNVWFNKLDKASQKIRNGETHGLMIGPHSSNLLSEIILTSVDRKLILKGYEFIRNIDDYTCFVDTYEKAELFLIELNKYLREYDLALNHKKTTIEELPQASSEYWIQKLRDMNIIGRYGIVDYNTARAYLDTAVNVMQTNGNNASAIFLQLKFLEKRKFQLMHRNIV